MKKLIFAAVMLLASVAQAQESFVLPPDTAGRYSSFLRLLPTYVNARVLAAGVNESFTVPATARYVIFSSTCGVYYVKTGGTAAVPAADVTDGSGSELNPAGYFIEGATSLGVISPSACIVTAAFYK